MMRIAAIAVALAAVYALTLASADPVDLATGVLLGAVLATVLRARLRLEPEGARVRPASRVARFPLFAAAVLAEAAGGTWDVALRVLGLRDVDRPGVVRVPIGDRSERGVAVSALAATLSPGSVLIDVDWARGDMLMHVIDASDPDAVRDRMQRFYDRYQRRVFP